MPESGNVGKFVKAELGMKITCGFEMMYHFRKKKGDEGKAGTWEAFRDDIRASEVLSTPMKSRDEILALPHSADDFKNQELPPSDDDSWLYGGEDGLNTALQEMQKEMELYDLKRTMTHKWNTYFEL